jgi:putative alpha-1,2-mannosidase
LTRTFIRHEEIVAGGELHFVMQSRPDKHWGAATKGRPFSLSR